MDFSNVVAEDIDGDGDKDDISLDGASPRSLPPIWAEVSVVPKFLCRSTSIFNNPNIAAQNSCRR
jgi:hypothetical protein